MNRRPQLRIGLFTHSTNPRGGVVHVLELASAMIQLGHAVTVHAPAMKGQQFFRPTAARQVLIPAEPVDGGLAGLVRQRVGEYVHFLNRQEYEFDIYHAHDGISGSALADLVERGAIRGFVRTIHHLDDFADDYLRRTQDRSVTEAQAWLCVSDVWRGRLRNRYGVDAIAVGNGVDLMLFSARRQPSDQHIRDRMIGQRPGPVFVAVGGVERRKNTLNILRAFQIVRQTIRDATLLIVGGASLLDHSAYRTEFDAALSAAGDGLADAIIVTGPLPDRDMPGIYRLANALVFPSTVEGFGLVVLEAMACATPVITSRIAPFTEYLNDDSAMLVAPGDVTQIAGAMCRVVNDRLLGARLVNEGLEVARRFSWSAVAARHEEVYDQICGLNGRRDYARNAI